MRRETYRSDIDGNQELDLLCKGTRNCNTFQQFCFFREFDIPHHLNIVLFKELFKIRGAKAGKRSFLNRFNTLYIRSYIFNSEKTHDRLRQFDQEIFKIFLRWDFFLLHTKAVHFIQKHNKRSQFRSIF